MSDITDKDDIHPDDMNAFRAAFFAAKEEGTYLSPLTEGLIAYEQQRQSRALLERLNKIYPNDRS